MCGRFTATFEFSDIRVRWNLDGDLAKYTPRFNIAPEQTSSTIPVIVVTRAATTAGLSLAINEVLGESPFYR
jgi:putative SOS response-associated peptidase YedK